MTLVLTCGLFLGFARLVSEVVDGWGGRKIEERQENWRVR